MGIEKKDPANFSPSVEIPAKVDSFRFWCQKVLPLVYDDSLSYYELLCKVVNYLNNTIADVNTLGTDVDNLNNAYNELQSYVNDYFSTLDVQEEINNKLDNMAQSGELSNIIARFTARYYNTFIDAINDSNNIYNNTFIKTGGYYTINDGGEGLYYIENSAKNWSIKLGNLYANLLHNGSIHYKQLGGKADGTNETSILSKLLSLYSTDNIIAILDGGTIMTDKLTYTDKIFIIGNKTNIIGSTNDTVPLDVSTCKFLHMENITFSPYALLESHGENYDKVNSSRTIYLQEIEATGNGEPINYGLFINNKRPQNYNDNNNGVYSKYGIGITNYSGYNALMIVNKSVNENGEVINGGADNSAIGIVDRVNGVASPCILIDTNRHILRSGESTAPKIDISNDGRIGIGCNTDNNDANVSGIGVLKIYYPTPTINIKDKNTGNVLSMYFDNNFNLSFKGKNLLNGNPTDGYILPLIKNGMNQGLLFKSGQIYISSKGVLSYSNYNYIDNENSGRIILSTNAQPTSNRPTSFENNDHDRGYMMFDRTLNKPIWWNGVNWVDATGTIV